MPLNEQPLHPLMMAFVPVFLTAAKAYA